jgi:di/tricarboxylate transporter
MVMNIYQKNALMSVIAIAIAVFALASGQIDGEITEIPWKLIALFVVISLISAVLVRAKSGKAAVQGTKKKKSAK